MKILIIFLLALFILGCSKQEQKNKSTGSDSTRDIKNNLTETKILEIKIDTLIVEKVIDKQIEFTFEGVYPKIIINGDENFERELNLIIKRKLDDYIQKSREGGFADLGISFEILTNDKNYLSIVQNITGMVSGGGTSCGLILDAYTINVDLQKGKILTNEDLNAGNLNISDFNRTVVKYLKNKIDYSDIDIENIPQAKNKADLLKFNYALKNGNLVLVEFAMPAACVSKDIYIIPLNILQNTQESNNNSGSQSGNSTEASELVKNWITALGKQDFSTAYNMMTPKARGDYHKFISTKAYGGITKTNIHSVDVTSSSGCYYEVVAVYDSYDPSNRDGKFTQKFEVSNCDGSWLITSVKNMKVEYFR